MINKLKYATISDIGITNLIFFDKEKVDQLVEFCNNNLISYLPSRDRRSIYKLNVDSFIHCKLEKELCVNPFDRLFDNNTLKKFKKVDHNEIRFITEGSKIKGVVHIVDYNNEFLQVEFYRAFYRFENNVRQLLIKNNYSNEDFLEWVKLKSKDENNIQSNNHWIQRYNSLMPTDSKELDRVKLQRLELNPFQTFYLKELLQFSFDLKLLDRTFVNIDEVCSLRNSIAHNKDFTSVMEDTNSGELIYHFKNLQKFINHANIFFTAYEYLEELKN